MSKKPVLVAIDEQFKRPRVPRRDPSQRLGVGQLLAGVAYFLARSRPRRWAVHHRSLHRLLYGRVSKMDLKLLGVRFFGLVQDHDDGGDDTGPQAVLVAL